MIQFLEFIVLLSGVGNLTISWTLFKEIHWQDVVIIIISVIYSISPNQQVNYFFFYFYKISDILFPIKPKPEDKSYTEA